MTVRSLKHTERESFPEGLTEEERRYLKAGDWILPAAFIIAVATLPAILGLLYRHMKALFP